MIELKLSLAKLIHTFDVSMATDQKVEQVHTTTLGPKNGLFLNVKPFNL